MPADPISVLHIITTIERGGAEKQLLILCKEQVKKGLSVSVVFLKGIPELEDEFLKLEVSVFKLRRTFFFSQIFEFSLLIRNLDVSLIHAHLPRAELVASLALFKLPLIVSRHNAEPFYPNRNSLLSLLLSNLCVFRAKKVIAISKSVEKYLTSTLEVLQTSKIEVVHYGYSFRQTSELQVSHLRSMNNQIRVLSIGRLVPQKDFPTLLEGLYKCRQLGCSFSAKLVGEGPLKENLLQLSEGFGLLEEVEFLPKTKDVDALYNWADVFVLASSYEGFGLVILEAIDHGVPIISSNNDAAKEILGNEYAGLFEIGNAESLASLIFESNDLRPKLIRALESRKSSFSATRMSSDLFRVYLEVIS